MKNIAIAATLALSAGAAHATTFSFASDFAADTSWTFTGAGTPSAATIRDAVPVTDLLALFRDDDNGPLPPSGPFLDFNANMGIRWVSSTPTTGGAFVHIYAMDVGAFQFDDILGNTEFRVTYFNAVMTVLGTEFAWGSTATIQGADNANGGSVTWFAANTDAAYGIFAGNSVGPDDFAFTLTEINTSGRRPLGNLPRGVAIDQQTRLPTQQWWSEGSFSGGAYWVPAPGATALLLAGAGLVARRRRI
ncbi:MAG: PEP-CTERM sorting domain-containing protein [Planctomycetota bacterium]|nr:PEP-CTERM sorting domain-containing protein [Planctomycetota bacterium]